MLLPALLCIFLMGWLMYCIGDQKRPIKKPPKPLKKDTIIDNVTIMPIVYEETPEIVD